MKTLLFRLDGTEQVLTGSFEFNKATFWGISGFVNSLPINNTGGAVCVGTIAGQLPAVIKTGDFINWTMPEKKVEIIDNMFTKGISGDGLYIVSYL